MFDQRQRYIFRNRQRAEKRPGLERDTDPLEKA